jgi:CheY-like chemotaxis protein/HPt (histidine-containing phosphotransfer) domain-containing protein
LRVLVAEDNVVNQRVAQRMLEKLGCRVDVAANGSETVQMLQLLPYDVIFMDCQMPELDGYEATREIRARESASAGKHRTTVIAMTANTMLGDRERCLAAGMDDYVPKPVRIDDLRAALDRWRPHAPIAPTPEDAPAEPSEPTIDRAQLESLRDLQDPGDPDVIRELIEMFLGDAQRSLDAIRAASASEDSATLTRAAHTLKGSSANMGAQQLSTLSRRIEERARSHSLAGLEGLLAEMEPEMHRVRTALEAYLNESPDR